MRIVRDSATGGRFWAPLSLNVKLTFVPVGRNVQRNKLELVQSIHFEASPIHWTTRPSRPEVAKALFVDTDGDNVPDSELPSPSNFAAGTRSKALMAPELAEDEIFIYNHQAPQHTHVTSYTGPATALE
jgi:hypothetical protein